MNPENRDPNLNPNNDPAQQPNQDQPTVFGQQGSDASASVPEASVAPQPEQSVESAPEPKPPKSSNKVVAGLVVVVVLLLIGAAVYALTRDSSDDGSNNTDDTNNSQNDDTQAQAGLELTEFSNEAFSIMVPADFKSAQTGVSLVSFASQDTQDGKVGSSVVVGFESSDDPAAAVDSTLTASTEVGKASEIAPGTVTEVTFGGLSGKSYVADYEHTTDQSEGTSYTVVLAGQDKVFIITVAAYGADKDALLASYDEMMSSFTEK